MLRLHCAAADEVCSSASRATAPIAPGWSVTADTDQLLTSSDAIPALLPIVARTPPAHTAALLRSLLNHNALTRLSVIVASEFTSLPSLLSIAELKSHEPAKLAVHALPIDPLPSVPEAVWHTIERMPRLRSVVVLEPGALVLGAGALARGR